MDDRRDAQEVEIIVDRTGKVWVNVDGVCALRISHARVVSIDDPIRGRDVVYSAEKPFVMPTEDLFAGIDDRPASEDFSDTPAHIRDKEF